MIYQFGDFELDEDYWELRENGCVVETPPKALALLHYLLRNRNRVVSKAELFDALWGGVQVTEASLNNAVSLVRRLLHDDGQRQNVVKTARSRGYRFVGSARELPVARAEAASVAEPNEPRKTAISGLFSRLLPEEPAAIRQSRA